MSEEPVFDTAFSAEPGAIIAVSPLIRRLLAPNPGPFTFRGTCTYIIGRGEVAVLDPGPDDPAHVAALLAALNGETVTHIVVSHTHRDHSPAARALQRATAAPIVGCGPHRAARPLAEGETTGLEGSGDRAHRPDRELADGNAIEGPGWRLETVATPGHTANHLAFALPQERALFSGDCVMAWSTTIVAPPDGSMRDYMASLERLRRREDAVHWPGHGGPVRDPPRFLRALMHHRRQREAAILGRLDTGERSIPAMVTAIYQGLPPALRGAAGLSVFAHLEDLVERGIVVTDGPPTLGSDYRLRR